MTKGLFGVGGAAETLAEEACKVVASSTQGGGTGFFVASTGLCDIFVSTATLFEQKAEAVTGVCKAAVTGFCEEGACGGEVLGAVGFFVVCGEGGTTGHCTVVAGFLVCLEALCRGEFVALDIELCGVIASVGITEFAGLLEGGVSSGGIGL